MSNTGAGIEGMRSQSALARMVAASLREEDFTLLDIGCAGGLAPGWRMFGDRLAAVGIDGTAAEIDRLTQAESNSKVHYRAGLVGVPQGHSLSARIAGKPWWSNWADGRLAYERHQHLEAAAAQGRAPLSLQNYFLQLGERIAWTAVTDPDTDYVASFPDETPETEPEDGPIYLPRLIAQTGLEDIDFFKLDIDGPDFEVLRSMGAILERPTLLGAALEVTFVGSHDANDNSFHNVDRLMREKGFDLFGLSVRTYASAALPFSYMGEHPAQTYGGRPLQGDAIYFRDLASPVRRAQAATLSVEKLGKLAALFALFGLQDQAAEMLIVHGEALGAWMDIPSALDALAAEVQENDGAPAIPYTDYMAAFDRREPRFFDVYGRRNAWMEGLKSEAAAATRLRARVAALEADKAALETRIQDLQTAPRAKPGGWFGRAD